MDVIARYPEFSPLSLEAVQAIKTDLQLLKDGMSELTFGSLYFFRNSYKYKISRFNERTLLFLGEERKKPFFFTIGDPLPIAIIKELYEDCAYWKLISESYLNNNAALFQTFKGAPTEDRDNFDYLYTRLSLSTLSGKQLHKKKNHVNGFLTNYPDFTLKKLDADTKKDAGKILDIWATEQSDLQETDYEAAQQALALPETDGFTGLILYVQGTPVAWCLAEFAAQGATAVVHFEKARTDFRGSYQYINYAFAQSLPEHIVYINCEQDLGDEGLRHAKMSYKPEGFVKKYRLDKGAL
ncbi:hypothetical protein HMPREF1222_01438 [Treponema vincentii F0403]|uniref:Phosphatidylglycerol lysyltransferase C-terminal domain-containing protein n=1 Tax=Treponema vincentii F0403 TaxID=1125702 RepID=S3MCT2_9SPIR|nr:phosphatidylglycerol lysyltransferase domain-containing protein [Treponema vincentii]EPF46859.1 hypothetical protein HMPREF1222_01438 [Treponema vincentii F0403]